MDTGRGTRRGFSDRLAQIRRTAGALDNITAVTGENTVIMSLMNGVDSEEIIAEKAGAEHLLHAVIKVASHKENDGYVFFQP